MAKTEILYCSACNTVITWELFAGNNLDLCLVPRQRRQTHLSVPPYKDRDSDRDRDTCLYLPRPREKEGERENKRKKFVRKEKINQQSFNQNATFGRVRLRNPIFEFIWKLLWFLVILLRFFWLKSRNLCVFIQVFVLQYFSKL